MNRFAAVPLTLTLLLLGLVACGGGDAPSREEFAADAEKICQDAESQLENVAEDASTPDEIADAVDEVIEASQESVDKLRALDQPDGDDGEAVERFVNAVETDIEDKGIPALEDLRDALRDNDEQAAKQATERLQSLQTTNSDELAKEIGATACGS